MKEMISLEEARELVLANVDPLPQETVPVLEAVGRVAAEDLRCARPSGLPRASRRRWRWM